MIEVNKNGTVNARDIYNDIGIKTRFNTWISRSLDYVDAKENIDFCSKVGESTGGRPSIDYELSIEIAKEICLVQPNEKSKKLRKELIKLSEQHETGYSFTTPQIEGLIDLSRAVTLISIQQEVERKHFNIYNDKYTWYEYRARLLGYSTKNVIEAMQKVNKKHHSLRASLIQLDANELIRVGVIDFMMALGKSPEYATNVGNLCKSIASKAKFGNIIWDDTIENPLKINEGDINERKNSFETTKKSLKYLL